MTASVTVGEFSRLTHLSVKTLHHYHEIGLLAPATIDPSSGYRRYGTDQVDTALLIRRLRELRMPLPEVRARRRGVRRRRPGRRRSGRHLERMEQELAHTRDVVTSLREMLTPGRPVARCRLPVHPGVPCVRRDRACRARRDRALVRVRLREARRGRPVASGATSGATYSDEFFTDDAGEVVAFLPVAPDQPPADGVELVDLPGGFFAIAVHAGPMTDFDRTLRRARQPRRGVLRGGAGTDPGAVPHRPGRRPRPGRLPNRDLLADPADPCAERLNHVHHPRAASPSTAPTPPRSPPSGPACCRPRSMPRATSSSPP